MKIVRVEVKRITAKSVPIIKVRTRLSLRLRRLLRWPLRVLGSICCVIRHFLPKRVYLSLE